MRSSTKAWLFLVAFSLILVFLGHIIAGRQGLLWGLVLSLSVNSAVYFFSDQRIINNFPGRAMEGQDPWGLAQIVTLIAKRARMPNPHIIVLPESAAQAISVGRSWKSGTLIFTEGLLESLSQEELEAAVAYLLATIRRQDTLILGMASSFCGFAMFISQKLDALTRVILGSRKEFDSFLSHPFTYMISPFVFPILRLVVSSATYYSADAQAAEYLGDPRRIAQVLWKLNSYRSTKPFSAPASMAHLFIVNPLTTSGLGRYFQAQPSVEKRIKKLLGYYPI